MNNVKRNKTEPKVEREAGRCHAEGWPRLDTKRNLRRGCNRAGIVIRVGTERHAAAELFYLLVSLSPGWRKMMQNEMTMTRSKSKPQSRTELWRCPNCGHEVSIGVPAMQASCSNKEKHTSSTVEMELVHSFWDDNINGRNVKFYERS